jgi:hypothetical protein
MNPYNSHRRSNQHLQLEAMNDENSFDDEDEDSKWSEQYNSRQRYQNPPLENGNPDIKMKETGRFEHLQLDHKDSESVLNQYKNP